MKKREVVEIISQYFKYSHEFEMLNTFLNKDFKCYDKEGNIKPEIDKSSQQYINETNYRRKYVVRKNSLVNEINRWLDEEVDE